MRKQSKHNSQKNGVLMSRVRPTERSAKLISRLSEVSNKNGVQMSRVRPTEAEVNKSRTQR